MLIDGGWSKRRCPSSPARSGIPGAARMDLTKSIPAIDIPMLVEYAKSKNVRIWLITHFRDVHDQMDEAFAQFEKWGIAGVKIDFMDRTDQWMVNWYRTAAQESRRTPPHGRLPRRVQARRDARAPTPTC